MSQWYLGINSQQVGPLSSEEVVAKLRVGAIDGRTLVWRDGFSGWMPLARSELAAHLGASGPCPEEGALPMPLSPVRAPESNETGIAGFWIRVAACVVDVVLLVSASLILNVVAAVVIGLVFSLNQKSMGSAERLIKTVALVLPFCLHFLYFGVAQSLFGATPGKAMCGLRVVGQGWRPLRLGQGLLRYLVREGVSFPLAGLGVLAVAFSRHKQGWHDHVAQTMVVTTQAWYARQEWSGQDQVTAPERIAA